ncbi:RhuM family protein [Primorskyibacter sp. 2E107]|uniref:RhuM family protein n=1 Tax=Primorskyibacter sp. 2E107 TaxID=3403458 RepID=UPI003AF6BDAC
MADKKDLIEPIDASFDDLVSAVAPRATPLHKREDEHVVALTEMVEYSDPGAHDTITFRLDPGTETIWATQAQIAELFQTDQSGVSRHLKNIFDDGELDAGSNMQKMHSAGSAKPVQVYSLDTVISVGYRVNSKAATRFRQWATGIIKAFIEDGYVINDAALRKSPEKLNRLAAELRALRSEEKQVYAKVRECFKISASDYEPSSQQVRTFYALLQDKFLHAVTGQTASKLVLDRADHREDNMGVQTFSGKLPNVAEAKTGKNYLQSEELYRLHLLSEQFLLYAEARALAGQKMTMKSLHQQLDRLLTLNDYPVFDGYRDFLKDDAERHARQELTLFKKRMALESKGVKYDEEALADGEYDDMLLEWVQAP